MIAAFGPIWILTALGYLARRTRLLDEHAVSVLGRFVFHLAMPAALFLTLSRMPLSGFALRPLLVFAASTAVTMGLGWWAAGRLFGREPAERPIWGMSAGYVNSANLGIPVALQVLGDLAFLVEVVLVQVLVVTPVVLVALDRHQDEQGRVRLRRLATLPVRNPVILGSALGVLASVLDVRPPAMVHTSLTLLAASAVPVALVALGASLHRDEPGPGASAVEVATISALKLVAQPVVALLLGAWVLDLSERELLAVVVCAGLPTAQNTFIFAREYGVAEALASRAVLVTTALSLGSLAVTVALLRP